LQGYFSRQKPLNNSKGGGAINLKACFSLQRQLSRLFI
jgi:hypothetical protein